MSLGDSDAMLPQFKLSLFENINITARLSKSGNPIAQAGDFDSAQIATQNTNQSLIELEISKPVEITE